MPDEPVQAAPAAEDPIDRAIERWFADEFHGSPVARDTEIYSHVFHAKEKLKELLKRSR